MNTDRLCMGCMNDNGGEKICPICGHDASQDNDGRYLSPGTWLNANRYLVGAVIDEGGDGVTYIGWDNDVNAVVNIREYFPAGLAVRGRDRMAVNPAEGKGLVFNRGMEDFVKLYTELSKFPVSTAILQVGDVFEANGTVYAVSSTVSGITLKAFLLRNGGALTWEQVRLLFLPILSTLSELHAGGIVHRAISPDTIIVGRDGKLRLTGFCIKDARVERTDFLAQIPTGYAAPEQYGGLEVEAGPAADIYAIGAVMFRCLIGTTPPDAKERMSNDRLSIPAKITETVSKHTLSAIANALRLDPQTRTASAEHLRSMLETAPPLPTATDESEEKPSKKKNGGNKHYGLIAAGITAAVFLVIAVIVLIVFHGSIFSGGRTNSEDISSVAPPTVSETESTVNPDPDVVTYAVPDYSGYRYSEIIQNADLSEKFDVVIAGKQYSSSVERGQVCGQTVAPGTQVQRDTEIGLTISLGSSTVSMPGLTGYTRDQAYITLLEYGFLPANIEFVERYDDTAPPATVLSTSAKRGDSVSLDDAIVVYINSYVPEEETTFD